MHQDGRDTGVYDTRGEHVHDAVPLEEIIDQLESAGDAFEHVANTVDSNAVEES